MNSRIYMLSKLLGKFIFYNILDLSNVSSKY